MAEVYAGHSQFVLLNRQRRWFDSRTVLSVTVVTLSVIIFCGVYTILLKGPDVVLLPRPNTFHVPKQWLTRAKLYNSIYHNESKTNFTKNVAARPENLTAQKEYKLICYYNFPPEDDYDALFPEDIDPFLCTHINVAFASVSNNSLTLSKGELIVVKRVVELKNSNPRLKVLVSVGGAGNDGGFAEMVLNHANRKTFIRSILDYVKTYNIDGVDLDWEFPSRLDIHEKHQAMHFTQLLEEFRATINRQTKHRFLVTAAVAAPAFLIDTSYDVQYMNQFVDFINVMTYDYHLYSKLTPFTGLNAPLFQTPQDKGYFASMNINYSVNYWQSLGMDKAKIVVGLPTYGHTFRLTNVLNHGLYAPARGNGRSGSNGFINYGLVCNFMSTNKVTPFYESGAESPYVTKSSEWISFDSEQSLSVKAEYVKNHGFGGVMVYSLNADDYNGSCKLDKNVASIPFPLTRKLREVLDPRYSIS